MNEFTYSNLNKTQYRAITYDWQQMISNLDGSSCLYCLSDFQVMWLRANIPYMSWNTRWINCPCTAEQLAQMSAELEYNLMTCIDVQPFQIQSLYNQMMTSQLAGYQAAWDTDPTPSGVNPASPDDFFNGDDSTARNLALCTACKIYVYSYASNWLSLATLILGIAIVTVLPALIALVGGVIAGIVQNSLALIAIDYFTAMQNTSALDAVACLMADNLSGQAITSANFSTSLDSTLTGDAELARNVIASDLDKFANWLSFVNALGNAYVLAQIDVYDCAVCPLERLSGDGNADMTAIDFMAIATTYDSGLDTYVSGYSAVGPSRFCQVEFDFGAPATIVATTWSVRAQRTKPGVTNNINLYYDDVLVDSIEVPVTTEEVDYFVSGGADTVQKIRILAGIHVNSAIDGSMQLYKVAISQT